VLVGAVLLASACSFDESGPGLQDAGAISDTPMSIDAADGAADIDASAIDASDEDGSVTDAATDALPPPDATVDATPPPDATVDATPPPDAPTPDAGCPGWDLGIVTSNFHPCDIPAPTSDWSITSGRWRIDTSNETIQQLPAGSTGALPTHTIITQASGPDILVISVDSFTLASVAVDPTYLDAVGSRALAIVSFGDITIDAYLSVSAAGQLPGAGGESPNAVTADTLCAAGRGDNGIMQGSAGTGAGGGAYGGGGGRGAKVTGAGGDDHPIAGGTANGNVEISPLRGGCPGGRGANNTGPTNGWGGAGGGGLQLVAAGTITVNGVVMSAGGGARGTNTDQAGGGGAGSGGGILFEAAGTIDVSGVVAANGGGGGEGTYGGTYPGANGEDGHPVLNWPPPAPDVNPAAGGDTTNWGGPGGDGGAAGSAAGDGSLGNTSQNNCGGGGGGAGVGRIHFRAPTRTIDGAAHVSPTAHESSP